MKKIVCSGYCELLFTVCCVRSGKTGASPLIDVYPSSMFFAPAAIVPIAITTGSGEMAFRKMEFFRLVILRIKGCFLAFHNRTSCNQNIPNWDILIIPFWYNIVKGGCSIFRLKELRKKRRISQVSLAIALNMNQNSISRYETEERQADYKTLIAFADYFNVSIDYLLGRTDDPTYNG